MKKIYVWLVGCMMVWQSRSLGLDLGLEGRQLSLQEVERAKHHDPSIAQAIQDALLWHYKIPTTGLLKDPSFFPPRYSYLPHQFTLWELAPHKGQGVHVGIIDTEVGKGPDLAFAYNLKNIAPTKKNLGTLTTSLQPTLDHGSHTLGIIAGVNDHSSETTPLHDTGISGIAPHARITIFDAFTHGESSKVMLTKALESAHALKVDVVNMGLKIADAIDLDDPSTKALETALQQIPYTVAASGNSGEAHLSYPARFDCITLDVGAFSYTYDSYPIFEISQYETKKGPLFVAPGYNILSTGYSEKGEQPLYVFMGGTSTAAPIMTGFVALMLGEFQHDFTKKQLLTVVYSSGLFLHDTPEWKTRSVLGVLDMRTALFILHCLKKLKHQYPHVDFNDMNRFNAIVSHIHILVREPLGTSLFQTNFAPFIVTCKKHVPCPSDKDLETVILSVAQETMRRLDRGSAKDQKNSTLFSHLPQESQRRVESKINSNFSHD